MIEVALINCPINIHILLSSYDPNYKSLVALPIRPTCTRRRNVFTLSLDFVALKNIVISAIFRTNSLSSFVDG
jgi:hypothetical protein